MSSKTAHSVLSPAAKRSRRKGRRGEPKSRPSAADRVLSVEEMREELAGWRDAADEGRATFVLLVSGMVRGGGRSLRRHLASQAASQSSGSADAFGWLSGERLGVLIGWKDEGAADQRSELLSAFAKLLGETVAGPVERYRYPLPAVPAATVAGRNWPQVCEGGIERYFARPTPWWKRSLDVGVAAAALLLMAPLLAVVALLIKATSRGPVLYRQQRTGHGGEPFWMYKFRSMAVGADAEQAALQHLNVQDGPAFKIPRDPRVTWVGWWLRETCLDELPQLWNVLRGEMSLVGPRPLPCLESAACTGWRRRRLDVVPGITGLWQAQGRSTTSFDAWMRLDASYVERRSVRLDLTILLATLPLMVPRVRRATKKRIDSQLSISGDEQHPTGADNRAGHAAGDYDGRCAGVGHLRGEGP